MTREEAVTTLREKLARRRQLNAREPDNGMQKPQSIGLTFREAEGILEVLTDRLTRLSEAPK